MKEFLNVINKANVLVLVIVVLALATIMYLLFITRSQNQSIEMYRRAYAEIKVGDSRDAVVAAMGKPSEATECRYTPFNDPKREAEFRSKCYQQFRYILLMREFTFSFDRNGAVISKSEAVSP